MNDIATINEVFHYFASTVVYCHTLIIIVISVCIILINKEEKKVISTSLNFYSQYINYTYKLKSNVLQFTMHNG